MKNKLKVAIVLLILIVSGCSHYNNIPRQRSFFNTKSNEQPLKERGSLTSKNNKEEIAEDREKTLSIEEVTSNFQDNNSIEKYSKENFNSPKIIGTFIKPLKKKLDPKPYNFKQNSKKSNFSNYFIQKNTNKKRLPFWSYVTIIVLLIISLVVSISYLVEKLKQIINPKKIVTPTKKPKKWIKLASVLAMVFAIIAPTIFILAFVYFLLIGAGIWYAFLAIIYGSLYSCIAALLALVISWIVLLTTRKDVSEYKKERRIAMIAEEISILTLIVCLLILGAFLL